MSNYYDDATVGGWILQGADWNVMSEDIVNSDTFISALTASTSEINLLTGMDSVSTGAGDNDKLVTQGYVDDNSGAPGGATTQVQFNEAGAFGGDAAFTWNDTNKTLAISSSVTGVRLQITNSGTDYGFLVSQTNAAATESGFEIARGSDERARILNRQGLASGTNVLSRGLDSASTAGPILGLLNTDAGDDQACLAFQQTADIKVIDFDACIDQGTSHTTVAGSLKIEMPNGSIGYINFYT